MTDKRENYMLQFDLLTLLSLEVSKSYTLRYTTYKHTASIYTKNIILG